jgi:hypothetical protein
MNRTLMNHRLPRLRRRLLSIFALLLSLALPALPARAAGFTVSSLNDSGAGSLRQAILDTTAQAGPEACASGANNPHLKLLECVTLEGVREHQKALQEIADANNGNRASGTPGFDASVVYAKDVFEAAGYNVTVQPFQFQTPAGLATSYNVLAESKAGRPDNVVVVGAHLDSVYAGPGIQDNGSGSAAILEVAQQMANVQSSNGVRFALWGADEAGLAGSSYYVNNLDFEQQLNIALYLNFDMIGSPNHVFFVYDGDNSDAVGAGPGPFGSAQIEKLFERFYADRGIPSAGTDFDGRSDYFPFIMQGIPSGGLFTGAEGIKTPAQAAIWGGTAGQPYDPCYHQACDTYDNVNLRALDVNSDALAFATLRYAMSTSDINGVPGNAGFPTTAVLDDFNRANGKLGGNWQGLSGTSFYKIASDKLDVQLGGPLVWKSALGASQEAFVTLSTIDPKSPSTGLVLKVQDSSRAEAGAILAVYDAKAKAVRVSAIRLGAKSWTLYPNQAASFANGDVLGARALPNGDMQIYQNGTLIATITLNSADKAFFNAKGGKIGLWTLAAPKAYFDDFGGGTAMP